MAGSDGGSLMLWPRRDSKLRCWARAPVIGLACLGWLSAVAYWALGFWSGAWFAPTQHPVITVSYGSLGVCYGATGADGEDVEVPTGFFGGWNGGAGWEVLPVYSARPWYVRLPLWIPAVLFLGGAYWGWRRWREYVPGLCPRCGYDLRGSPHSRCPECGHEMQATAQGRGK